RDAEVPRRQPDSRAPRARSVHAGQAGPDRVRQREVHSGPPRGEGMPTHADTETTFEQLHVRIAAVQTYLDTFKADDFAGAEERKISLPWMQNKWMTGAEYVSQFALPNFYFHVSMTYGI